MDEILMEKVSKILGKDIKHDRIVATLEKLIVRIEQQRDEIKQLKSQTRFKSFLEIASENLRLAEQLKEAQTRVAFFEGLRSGLEIPRLGKRKARTKH